MTNPQPSPEAKLRKLIRGLKMEYYDLLHEFGYADFKLDKEESEKGYDEKEIWLEDVYATAFSYLLAEALAQQREDIRNRLPKLLNLKHTETEEEYVGKEWYNQALEEITKILDGDKEL